MRALLVMRSKNQLTQFNLIHIATIYTVIPTMASIQSEDQDNISLTSAFNTAQSSITDTKSFYISNIHEYYHIRKLDKLERKDRALIYYYKYYESGSVILIMRL